MRALLVGDSHMQALGPRLVELLDPLGVEAIGGLANAGKSTEWYAQQNLVANAVATHQPDVVVFVLSGNDQCWGEARQEAAARELIRQAAGARVVWVGPPAAMEPAVDRRHACSTDYSKAIMRRLRIPFIDLRPLTPLDKMRTDRVHFTADGYDEMAHSLAIPLAEKVFPHPSPRLGILVGLGSLLVASGIVWFTLRGAP